MPTFTIPISPVSVNQWKQPVKRGKYISMVLTKQYRSFSTGVQDYVLKNGCDGIQKCFSLTSDNPTGKYGLLIQYKKRSNSDYSNYPKAIEDALHHAGITPDDRYSAFSPIVFNGSPPKKGFTVTVLFGDELEIFLKIIEKKC